MEKCFKKLIAFLGPEYEVKVIDGELCGYRNFGNGLDVEISGVRLSNGLLGPRLQCRFIAVWEIKPRFRQRELICNTAGYLGASRMRAELARVAKQYGRANDA